MKMHPPRRMSREAIQVAVIACGLAKEANPGIVMKQFIEDELQADYPTVMVYLHSPAKWLIRSLTPAQLARLDLFKKDKPPTLPTRDDW